MAAKLSTIRDQFNKFRSKTPNLKGKGLRYPAELQMMIVAAKEEGASYGELSEASGLSEGGLYKIISRLQSGGPSRRPGRPSAAAGSHGAKSGGGKASTKSVKTTIGQAAGKPAVKKNVKPAAKPAQKSAAKPAAKPVQRSAAKPAAKPAQKSAAKPAQKSAAKPAAKPASKTAAKPRQATSQVAAARPSQPAPKAPKGGLPGTVASANQVAFTVEDGGKAWTLKMSAKDAVTLFSQMGGGSKNKK